MTPAGRKRQAAAKRKYWAARRAKSPVVNKAQGFALHSRRVWTIVAAIGKNGGSAIYVPYPDEGHGLVRLANNQDFLARAVRLLAENLGGRYEPTKQE